MTTKELIREKIDALYTEYKDKFHQNGDPYHLGIIDGLDIAERILDTLPDEPITSCNELAEAAGKWIWATTPPEKPGKYKVQLRYDTYSAIWNGVKWIDDASGFPIMGVFKWKPIKEEEQ